MEELGEVDRIKGTVTGNENLDADPKLTNFANGDFTLETRLTLSTDAMTRSTMTGMVPVMTSVCLVGTILFPMGGPPINRSCSVWTSPRLPCPRVALSPLNPPEPP